MECGERGVVLGGVGERDWKRVAGYWFVVEVEVVVVVVEEVEV